MSQTLNEGGTDMARHYKKKGVPFQIMLVCSYFYQIGAASFMQDAQHPAVSLTIGAIGIAIFTYCLFRVYYRKTKTLITNDLYRFTRHPMYTGALLMGMDIWWPTKMVHDFQYPLYTIGYWLSLTLFLVGILRAGYLQEQETLARFGEEAERYYKRTPRLFILYPFYFFAR